MAIDIMIENNSKEVLEALQRNIANGLEAVGSAAEGHAKDDCPVDTGRLRNSITYATKDFHSQGKSTPKSPDASPEDYELQGTPEENTVYIGTNVEYAPSVEFRDATHKVGKAHFLRDAIAKHGKEYKAIMEAALKA